MSRYGHRGGVGSNQYQVRGQARSHKAPAPDVGALERRKRAASSEHAGMRELAELAIDLAPSVRLRVARNPNADATALAILSRDAHTDVRQLVARHPNCDENTFILLSQDPNLTVRCQAAANRSCPSSVLSQMAHPKQDMGVLEAVASNPNSASKILGKVVHMADRVVGQSDRVRTAAASNPSSPPGLLARLAGDPNSAIRARVAANPSAPVGAVIQLVGDDNHAVRSRAVLHPLCPEHVRVIVALSR